MKPWTRDELILAINLYCKIPFGKIHISNRKIIRLAQLMGRTPGSVSYKLANFACIDPSLDRRGASHVSKLDKAVWNEFFEDWEAMAYESERRVAEIRTNKDALPKHGIPEGKTRDAVVRVRVNQSFFRKMILTSYNSKCCITGLPIERLLVASHIIPWSEDSKNRVNPQNGLCLNALHDRAFDRGLITLDESYRVVLSKEVVALDPKYNGLIRHSGGVTISLPNRFIPDQNFLAYHRQNIFVG